MKRAPLMLAAALVAGGVLLLSSPGGEPASPPDIPPPLPPTRLTAAEAWPGAERATMSATLSDGAPFTPGHFLDATTAIGTAPTPDGAAVRLVMHGAGGAFRELRRVPAERGPAFESFVSSPTHLVWAEATTDTTPRLWVADVGKPGARLLTADTGRAVFTGAPHDLVIGSGKVHWAAVDRAAGVTEIRSVPLGGGAVSVRTEKGLWRLSEWPWLTDGNEQTSAARLRNLTTGRDVAVDGSGTELLTCGPVWCRVTVVDERVDLMRHDGSERTTVANGVVRAVSADVAVLGRFEPYFEGRTAALVVHDRVTDSTVEISPAVNGAFTHGGMLWWSVKGGDAVVWHALDLRSVA